MKTQMNITNLKTLAVSVVTALVLTTGSFAQPSPDKSRNEEMISLNHLAVLMDKTEASIRYNAPTPAETEVFTEAINRLEELATVTEASVKYEAPEVIEVVNEIEMLDDLAGELEARLQYKAPQTENIFDVITCENDGYLLAEYK
jgi:flagellar basal body rod protein FlgC